MTEVLAPFDTPPDAAQQRPDREASPRTPFLITEQQVLFATAAAVPLQPARRWTAAVWAFLASAFVKSGNESRPKPRHYPSHHDFLEDACMAREMQRL